MRIRNEQSADVADIERVTVAAFENAVHSDHMEQFITRALRAADALTVSLVAEDDSGIIGHAAVSPVMISSGESGWFGLGPVAVTPERQGTGVGTQLVHAALEILREKGAHGCVVLGEPVYYARFGFFADPALVLDGVPPEYFQMISFTGSNPSGTVTYHQAFNVRS